MILLRDLSVNGILAPHNEHFSATLVVLYRVLLGTVGMVSYWPYLGVTFALHLVVAGIVYVVVRREASAAWALGAMAVMLLLGVGRRRHPVGVPVGDRRSGRSGDGGRGRRAAATGGRRGPADDRAGDIGRGAGVRRRYRPALAAHPAAGDAVAAPAGRPLSRLVRRVRCVGVTALRSPSLEGVPEYVLSGLTASAAGALGSTADGRRTGRLARPRVRARPGCARSRRSSSRCSSPAWRSSRSPGLSAPISVRSRRRPRGTSTSSAPALIIAGAVLLARIPKPLGSVVGAAVLVVALVGNTSS